MLCDSCKQNEAVIHRIVVIMVKIRAASVRPVRQVFRRFDL